MVTLQPVRVAVVGVLLAGCGRVDFDAMADAQVSCARGLRIGDLGAGVSQIRASRDGFVAAWTSTQTLDFATLDDNANVLGAGTIDAITTTRLHRPSVAARGSEVAVAYDEGALRVAIFDGTEILPGISFAAGFTPRDPSLVATSEGYAVAWSDQRTGNAEIHFQRLSPAGLQIDAPTQVSTSSATSGSASLAYNGQDFLVAWNDGGESIHVRRIGADGALLGAEISAVATNGSEPELAWIDDGFALAWLDNRTSSKQAMVSWRHPDGGARGGAIEISFITGWIVAHDIAWTGGELAVAMTLEVNNPTDQGDGTAFVRVNESTGVLAPPDAVAPEFSTDAQYPSVAARGSRVLIAQNQRFAATPGGAGVYVFCR